MLAVGQYTLLDKWYTWRVSTFLFRGYMPMLRRTLLLLAAAASLFAGSTLRAADPTIPLHVLYVSPAASDRATQFEQFLKKRFSKVSVARTGQFDAAVAKHGGCRAAGLGPGE